MRRVTVTRRLMAFLRYRILGSEASLILRTSGYDHYRQACIKTIIRNKLSRREHAHFIQMSLAVVPIRNPAISCRSW